MKFAAVIIGFLAVFSQSFSQTGRTVWTKGGHTSAVKHLYFDDAGKLVSSGGSMLGRPYSYGGFINDPSIYTWDIYSDNILESYYSGTESYFYQNSNIEWNSQEIQLMRATNSLVTGSYEQMSFSAFSTQQNEYFVGTHLFVFDRLSGAQLDSIIIKQDSNVAFALHPFKKEIAYRSGKNIITVRDLITKETKCTVNFSNPLAIEYSSDGNSFAVASRDSGMSLWNSQTGELLFQIPHESPVYLLHYYQAAKKFIGIDSARNFIMLRPKEGIKNVQATGHQAPVTGIATSMSYFILSSLDSSISFRDPQTPIVRFSKKFKSGITSIAIKNDGESIAVGLDNGDIEITNAEDEIYKEDNRRNLSVFKGKSEEVKIFPDNSKILVQYKNIIDIPYNFIIFDKATGDTLPPILSSGKYFVSDISPDFRYVALKRNDSVFVAEVDNLSSVRFITKRTSPVPGLNNIILTFSPDSRILATSGLGEYWTNFWNIESGQLIGRIPKKMNHRPKSSFSPDGSLFLSADTTGTEQELKPALWKMSDFSLYKSFPVVFNDATVSHDNKFIAVRAVPFESWKTQIWDVETVSLLQEIVADSTAFKTRSYTKTITDFDFTTDSKYLVITQNQIYFWDIANKKIAFVLENPIAPEEFTHIDFTSDGRYLVSAGKSVRLWDLNGITSVENETPVLKTTDLLKVFPNPSNGILTLQLDAFKNISSGEIRIYNSLGMLLKTVPAEFLKEMKIDCSELSGGVYFVELSSEKGVISRTSFIIAQ